MKKKFFINSFSYKLLIISFLLIILLINKYYYNILNLISKIYFFKQKESKLPICYNYSIFIYKYAYAPFEEQPIAVNIGDYIQSLAALQYIPKNCRPNLIDRDKIEYYNGPKTTVLMNCWLRIFNGTRTISDKITPIITSLHISNVYDISSTTINNLKKFSSIGCRDFYTLEGLKRKGIDSYFSGCLTTTLDIDYSVKNSERTNDIVFADYNFDYDDRIKNYILSLKSYNFSR